MREKLELNAIPIITRVRSCSERGVNVLSWAFDSLHASKAHDKGNK